MLVNVGLVWRLPELTVERFHEIWARDYADLMLGQDEVAFYAQCQITGIEAGSVSGLDVYGSPPDGIALVGFANKEAAAAMRESAALRNRAPGLLEQFCLRTVAVFSAVQHRTAIGPDGLATLRVPAPDTESVRSETEQGVELVCRGLGRAPQPFAELILHRESLSISADEPGEALTLGCTRTVMRRGN